MRVSYVHIIIYALLLMFCQGVFGGSSFEFVGYLGGKGTGEGEFESPLGISVDVNGFVYVADSGNHRIQKFSRRGEFVDYRGGLGWSGEQFDKPYDIYAKSVLDIFIVDYNANRIIRYDKDLNYLSSMTADDITDDTFIFGKYRVVAIGKLYQRFVEYHVLFRCGHSIYRTVKRKCLYFADNGIGHIRGHYILSFQCELQIRKFR